MSSLLLRGCCAIVLLTTLACSSHPAVAPKNAGAEARNGETEKKPRKQRPRLIAPPPAYGNKIVLDSSTETVACADEQRLDG